MPADANNVIISTCGQDSTQCSMTTNADLLEAQCTIDSNDRPGSYEYKLYPATSWRNSVMMKSKLLGDGDRRTMVGMIIGNIWSQ